MGFSLKKAVGAVTGAATGGLIGGTTMGPLGTLFGSASGGISGWGGSGGAGGYVPMPAAPEFESPLIQKGGQYYLPESLTMDSPILKTLTEQAQDPGLSPWGMAEVERAGRDALGAGATARQQLAMRGGLSGGAAERLASGTAGQAMMARQQARRADMLAKQDMLPKLAQMEGAQQQYNIQNILQAQQAKEQAKFNAYDSMMRAFAGQQQGAAIREAAKPQGFLSKTFSGIF